MSNRDFTNQFLNCIQPGHRVLDLGAGQGTFARMFVKRGAVVTAVDTRLPAFLDTSITLKRMTVEAFVPQAGTERYDLVFMRNILQFLDKHWVFETLFPWLDEQVIPNGVIGIETFYQDPDPPFDRFMRSLYTVKELATHLMSWTKLYARQYRHHGLDLNGQTRQFFVSDLIVKRLSER